jgi:hypothetical protein
MSVMSPKWSSVDNSTVTRGEDIFQSFYASLLEMNVPIHNLPCVNEHRWCSSFD